MESDPTELFFEWECEGRRMVCWSRGSIWVSLSIRMVLRRPRCVDSQCVCCDEGRPTGRMSLWKIWFFSFFLTWYNRFIFFFLFNWFIYYYYSFRTIKWSIWSVIWRCDHDEPERAGINIHWKRLQYADSGFWKLKRQREMIAYSYGSNMWCREWWKGRCDGEWKISSQAKHKRKRGKLNRKDQVWRWSREWKTQSSLCSKWHNVCFVLLFPFSTLNYRSLSGLSNSKTTTMQEDVINIIMSHQVQNNLPPTPEPHINTPISPQQLKLTPPLRTITDPPRIMQQSEDAGSGWASSMRWRKVFKRKHVTKRERRDGMTPTPLEKRKREWTRCEWIDCRWNMLFLQESSQIQTHPQRSPLEIRWTSAPNNTPFVLFLFLSFSTIDFRSLPRLSHSDSTIAHQQHTARHGWSSPIADGMKNQSGEKGSGQDSSMKWREAFERTWKNETREMKSHQPHQTRERENGQDSGGCPHFFSSVQPHLCLWNPESGSPPTPLSSQRNHPRHRPIRREARKRSVEVLHQYATKEHVWDLDAALQKWSKSNDTFEREKWNQIERSIRDEMEEAVLELVFLFLWYVFYFSNFHFKKASLKISLLQFRNNLMNRRINYFSI